MAIMERPHQDEARLNCRVGMRAFSLSQIKSGSQSLRTIISNQNRVVVRTVNMNVYSSSVRPGHVHPSTSVLKPMSKQTTNHSTLQPLGENRSYHNTTIRGHAGPFYGSQYSKPCAPAYVSKPSLPTSARREVHTTENARPGYSHGEHRTFYFKEETYCYENPPSSIGVDLCESYWSPRLHRPK